MLGECRWRGAEVPATPPPHRPPRPPAPVSSPQLPLRQPSAPPQRRRTLPAKHSGAGQRVASTAREANFSRHTPPAQPQRGEYSSQNELFPPHTPQPATAWRVQLAKRTFPATHPPTSHSVASTALRRAAARPPHPRPTPPPRPAPPSPAWAAPPSRSFPV